MVVPVRAAYRVEFRAVLSAPTLDPAVWTTFLACDTPALLVAGDALGSLRTLPDGCIDMVLTSPPYWRQRRYANATAIGGEATVRDYVAALLPICAEIRRVLKPTGSFWLNLGDAYERKNLCGIPWRVALALQDEGGWMLRNEVIWHKLKGGPDNARDKLRNVHEHVFHFVLSARPYYDVDAIRNAPRPTTQGVDGIVTATGVSGVRYRRQIQRSTALSAAERAAALAALDATLAKVNAGELFDFRMVIRGQQRVTHSDSTAVSGRATELARDGFYVLPYDNRGSKPGDVWEIVPEDSWRRDAHSAPFPEALCALPILATCPLGGIVLDPFVGTGTAIVAAVRRGRRGIGIDLSAEYLRTAEGRLGAMATGR
ncbi:MAG TPA: site-specific DNA-methyltransferase [Thermomicrobiales bacterium]